MITPDVRYYARLEDCTGKNKTPKYVVTVQAGYYQPMEELIGKDGKISMYLQTSKDSGSKKDNAPAMKLQAKDSLNFTGLKEFFVGGKISGFAYGYPFDKPTYGSKQKPNPFYNYSKDGFLFIMHQGQQGRPDCIELIVLPDAKDFIAGYCKALQMGGFDEALENWRRQAK